MLSRVALSLQVDHLPTRLQLAWRAKLQREQSPWDLPSGHGIYVYVDEVDAHYERAKSAGAKIVYPPEDTEWGTRRYRALDLDGYEWSFGTYKPSTGDN